MRLTLFKASALLSGAIAFLAVALFIGFLPLTILMVGAGYLLGRLKGSKGIPLLLFALPWVNALPSLAFNGYPFNTMAPLLFLLLGFLLAKRPRFGDSAEREGWMAPYSLLLLLLWLSVFFVFFRWSNLLHSPLALFRDTPVALTGERLSFALIYPVITLFLYSLSPWIYFLLRREPLEERVLFRSLALGYLPSFLLVLLQRFVSHRLFAQQWWGRIGQFNGGFSDFNAHGFFAGILLLWALSRLLMKRESLFSLTVSVSALAGGALSGSRTFFLFLLMGLFLFLSAKSVKRWAKALFLCGMVVALLVVGGTMKRRVGKSLQTVTASFRQGYQAVFPALDKVSNGRVTMAERTIAYLSSSPLVGIGAGHFLFSGKNLIYPERRLEDLALNQYLQVGAELGLIGLAVFLSFLFRLLSSRRGLSRFLLGALAFSLLFNNYFWFPEAILLFWVLAAMEGGFDTQPPPHRWIGAFVLLLALGANLAVLSRLDPVNPFRRHNRSYDYGLWAKEADSRGSFRWTRGEGGIYLYPSSSRRVRLFCAAPLEKFPGKEQRITLFWRGKRWSERAVREQGFQEWTLPPGEGFLELRISPAFVPLRLGLGGDPRELGAQLFLHGATP